VGKTINRTPNEEVERKLKTVTDLKAKYLKGRVRRLPLNRPVLR
jgi:hypothetical protein